MSKSSKPLILVDGSSYLFRAFYALPPLKNSKGVPTGAVYGVLNMLRKLIKDYDPEHIAVVFDPKGKTFRNELYAEYKANRAAMPDDLRVQIAPLHAAIRASGLPLIIMDGVEADDVIGALAMRAKDAGMKTLISTGDKDLAQLVDKDITLINTMTDKVMDIAGVKEKFGVAPEQIIDYLTLVGDASDNIPGVPKVGPKTAAKWLNQYDSLDNIIAHAEEIKGKVGEYLRDSIDTLKISKQLVTIKLDLELDVKPSELTPGEKNSAELIELYKDLEFKRWLEEAKNEAGEGAATKDTDYQTILTKKDFEQWIKKLSQAKTFAFDTETTSINAMQAELVGVSFAVESGQAAYVPVAHDYPEAPQQLDRDYVLEKLTALLNDPNNTVVGQNLKYDIKVLRNAGVEIGANKADTLLESYVLNSTSSRHDMDTLALKYLGETTIKFVDIAGKGAKQLTFNQIDLAQAAPYAAEDADITLQLHQHLWPMIAKEPSVKKVLLEIEWPLMPILADMEYTGVLIDKKILEKQSQELAVRIAEIQQEAHKLAGKEFNLGSTKQLREILFEDLAIPVVKKTPTGQPSTAEDVMQELALQHELPQLILEYRSLSKLKSTYTDALPLQINPNTGRVHTSYNQAVTSTGRLSSTDPNLQNIPIRTEEGRRIRKAFIAPKDHVIVAADYSQIELRIMAHLSDDPGLKKAFKQGLDVHSATASEVFGVPLDKVDADHRRHAKAINFGLMYGMSAFGLAKQLGIARKAAQEYIDVYFNRYPNVHKYMEQARALAAEQGYVETLFGRRLYIQEINSTNIPRRNAAERAAINAPLQGTSADIIKCAMIDLAAWIHKAKAPLKMIMQVHDELIFEVEKSFQDEAIDHVKSIMEGAAQLDVPLLVSVGMGHNWDEAH